VIIALLVLLMLGSCAPAKYVPKANEELYGTWINEKAARQKMVVTSDGWKQYLLLSDPTPVSAGTEEIISKWKDSEGNVWYKTIILHTEGVVMGNHYTLLNKLSKSATVWESVWSYVDNQDLKNPTYPNNIDPQNPNYGIYYRAGG
jgi:hypothetical protein